MARFLKRLGTRPMKFQFELSDLQLQMSVPVSQPLSVKWTRGPRTANTKTAAGVKGLYAWGGEPLVLVSTLYQDRKSQKFQPKKSEVYVRNTDDKSVGNIKLDLADYASAIPRTVDAELKLSKCSDKKAVLKVKVSCRWLKELQDKPMDDSASMVSDLSSLEVDTVADAGDIANMADLEDLREEVGSEQKELMEENEKLKKKVTKLEAQLKESKLSEQVMTDTHSKLQEEVAQLKSVAADGAARESRAAADKLAQAAQSLADVREQHKVARQEADELRQQLQQFVADKSTLESKLARCTADRDKALGELSQFENIKKLQQEWLSELQSKDNDIEALRAQLEAAAQVKEQYAALRTRVDEDESVLTSLRLQLKSTQRHHQQELDVLRAEVTSLTTTNETLQDKEREGEAHIARLQQRLEEAEELSRQNRLKVEQLAEKLERTEAELARVREEAVAAERAAQERFERRRGDLQASASASQLSNSANTHDDIDDAGAEATGVVAAEVGAAAGVGIALTDTRDNAEEVKLLRERVVLSEQRLSVLEEHLAREKQHTARAQTELESSLEKADALQQQLADAMTDVGRMRADVTALTRSKRSLQKQVEAETKRNGEAHLKIATLQSQTDDERTLRRDAEERINVLAAKLQELRKAAEAEKQALQLQVEQLEGEVADRHVELEHAQAASDRVTKQNQAILLGLRTNQAKTANTHRSVTQALEVEIQRLQEGRKKLAERVATVEAQLEAAEAELESERSSRSLLVRKAVAEAEGSLERSNAQLRDARKQLEAKQRELDEMQRDLTQAEKSIDILRQQNDAEVVGDSGSGGGGAEEDGAEERPTAVKSEQKTADGPAHEDLSVAGFRQREQMQELQYLRDMNRELSDHWKSLYGKTVFISESGDVSAAIRGNVASMSQAQLSQRIQAEVNFYADQLESSEQTLMAAKEAWGETNGILMKQITMLEKELASAKVERAESFSQASTEAHERQRLQRHLEKAKKKVEKMSEYMNKCEVQLVQKKVELVNTVDALHTLECENNVLKGLLQEREADTAAGDGAESKDARASSEKASTLIRNTRRGAPGTGITSQTVRETLVDSGPASTATSSATATAYATTTAIETSDESAS